MKKPVKEEKGETAPLWIISFADMISLLMAFFVMLLTMANEQSGKLCNTGTGIEAFELTLFGFRRTVAGFGLPELFGPANQGMSFGSHKPHYPVGTPDDTDETPRVIDARGEQLRRIFSGIENKAKMLTSQIEGQKPEFFSAQVNFAPGDSVINESARQFLSKFAADLEQGAGDKKLTLYVVGLAPQERDEKSQWIVSAQRAQAVADLLRSILPEAWKVNIHSWGAGAGGDWAKQDGPVPSRSQILIGVLKSNNTGPNM